MGINAAKGFIGKRGICIGRNTGGAIRFVLLVDEFELDEEDEGVEAEGEEEEGDADKAPVVEVVVEEEDDDDDDATALNVAEGDAVAPGNAANACVKLVDCVLECLDFLVEVDDEEEDD